MMPFRFVLPILIIAVAALSSPKPALVQAAPHPQATNGSPARGPIVYVSDFELDVFSGRAKTRSAPQAASRPATTSRQTASSGQPSGSSSTAQRIASSSPSPNKRNAAQTADPQLDDNPAERASELVNAVSENIVSALEEAGYKVHRLRAGEALPAKGLRIRGVFAEPDESNRARRLLVGGPSTTPRMVLYLGVNNLAKDEQPLYEIASPPSPDARYGPVITVTSYAPAARFELAKEPTDEELKKMAKQVAADLDSLLAANPLLSAE